MTDAPNTWVQVVLDVPLKGPFEYACAFEVQVGQRVIVPFGKGEKEKIGIVTALPETPDYDPKQLKSVIQVLQDLPAFDEQWMAFAAFAANYYQRPLGEVMLPAMPAPLRKPSAYLGKNSNGGPVARMEKRKKKATQTYPDIAPLALKPEQQVALDEIKSIDGFSTILLHGVTGSGKTEVYLQAAAHVLAKGKQVLFLVPEINLTPQFEKVLRGHLQALTGEDGIAVMHSGLTDTQRLQAWSDAQNGKAKVLLGTRLAIFGPLSHLGLMIVDEEHDASYKQQDGLRYSARDLAIWRAHQLKIPVVLGSATPSLESWCHAQSQRYRYIPMKQRAKTLHLPAIGLIDTSKQVLKEGFSTHLLNAIQERLNKGEQSLIYLNRRGYAPVLHCHSCAWMSTCPRCSVYTVIHRHAQFGNILQCHHCGFYGRVPLKCPECGELDLQALGRGTQRIEETLQEQFPNARLARIDADSTRLKGSAQVLFNQVHDNEIDILIGTQMVSKGHDFKNLGLVGILNADSALFSSDFRASERLFSQLVQVSGRAGRHFAGGEVLIQTQYPDHPVYRALQNHDYDGFANHSLQERQAAQLPPFVHQALLTTEARQLDDAISFLKNCRDCLAYEEFEPFKDLVSIYDPVPLRVVRVANVERAQLLVESYNRPLLQKFLPLWLAHVSALAKKHKVQCFIEVDPLEI